MSLRAILDEAVDGYGQPMKEFTVLATQRDPYRLDTPANHAIGQWLRDTWQQVHPEGTRIHLRGLHYKLVGRVARPDGKPYTNTDENWLWMSEKAAKAARWLGYLPWSAIRDARNSAPRVFAPTLDAPRWWLHTATVDVELPDTLEPRFRLYGDFLRQPYRQVVIAEKQGVEDLLLPVCKRVGATLALPAGEVSDTMVYDLLRAAVEDGRPLVIHQLGDFDPAGNQMAVSTSRTVQALVDSQFLGLEVTVHAPALTRDQCAAWGLPSTPLKATERRADRWVARMGWEQTELDAAVALAPDKFSRVVEKSLLQYYDTTVRDRQVSQRRELEEEANRELRKLLGDDKIAEIREQAEEELNKLDDLVQQINDALNIDPDEVGVTAPRAPDIEFGDFNPYEEPLFDSWDDFGAASQRLIARKRFLDIR